MRITSSMEARLYMNMNMSRNSNARKSLNNITSGELDKKVSQVRKSSGTSSNRKVDEETNLQSYISKAKETNEKTVQNAGDKVTSQNSYVSESDVCYQALHDKYTTLLEQAKSQSDPTAYIQDKYCNKNSPYYVSDLTDEERKTAYSNEMSMLNYGCINDGSMNDSLFRGITINGQDEVENQKTFNRQVTNSEINNLFKENGVNVPNENKLNFSIDPYSYELTVSGTDNKELKEKIESIFNSSDNAKELYNHILSSSSQSDVVKSTQYTQDGFTKLNLYHEVLTVTGIDIRDLDEKDGSYYTKDGQNITDIFNSKLEDMAENGNPHVPKKYTGACEEYVAGMVKEIATKGWKNIPDMPLSISYDNGKLQDSFQNVNYSENNKETVYSYGKNTFNTLS